MFLSDNPKYFVKISCQKRYSTIVDFKKHYGRKVIVLGSGNAQHKRCVSSNFTCDIFSKPPFVRFPFKEQDA